MPIVVGFARSGTTLLQLMLDSHPELAVTYESGFVPVAANLANPGSRMFYKRLWNTAKHAASKHTLRDEFFNTVTGFGNWEDFHVSREAFGDELQKIEPFTVNQGLRAFFRLFAARFGKSRWGDKTPFYVLHLRRVEAALPEAHFVHVIRDGRDSALSGRGMSFMSGNPDKIAREWVKQVTSGRRQGRSCARYVEVLYEDLIRDPPRILREICRFIDLEYDDCMERYHLRAAKRLAELGASYNSDGSVLASAAQRSVKHRLTGQPPQRSRISRWKTEMTKTELDRFNRIAGDLLEELGYEVR